LEQLGGPRRGEAIKITSRRPGVVWVLAHRGLRRLAGRVEAAVRLPRNTDLDSFLAAFALDRFQLIAEDAAKLPSRAGTGTVAGNLTDAALAVFGPNALAVIRLVTSRPTLMRQLQQSAAAGAPDLQTIEDAFAAYLDAEKQLGRIAADADTKTLALTLVGAVHHLFVTGRASGPNLADGCAGSS
jgi:hypothetical protein